MPAAAPHGRDADALRSLARRIDPSDPGAQNNLGVFYYERGLTADALAAFSRALELDPEMRIAQDNLETVQRESGWFDARIAELGDRLTREPGSARVRLELARAYRALGQYDRATEQYEALLRADPADPGALVQLGLLEQARGRQERASDWFARACDADPQSSVARLHLGRACYNRGLNDRALTVLIEAAALNPDHAEVHYLLGFLYGDLGQHEAARAATRRAIALNPTLGTAQPNLLIGGVRGGAPRRRPAGLAAEEGAALQPHLSLAVAFRKRGYLAEALREYRLAIEAGEDEPAALEGLAETRLLREEHGAALELYDGLLERQPGNAELWSERGVCLHQAGRREEARGSYRRAVDADPSYAIGWNNLGVVSAADPDGATAQECFETAVRLRPDFWAARRNLALLHLERGRPQAALAEYRAALSDPAGDAAAWNGVGLVLMELRRHADARNAFARAVERDPNFAPARYNLGFALGQLGAFDDALRETRRALELDPFYLPQTYALALQLQFEETLLQIPPSLSRAPGTGARLDFEFEPALLDELFGSLAPAEPAPTPDEDPFALARDLMGKGLLDRAAAELHQAVRRGAPRARAAVLLGELYARRGLSGEALERYREALRLEPGDLAARQGEARALVALGAGADALEAASRLAALQPANPEALLLRAQARQLTGDLAGAAADAASAARLAPGRADLLLQQGGIARQLGQPERALESLRGALELDPSLVQGWFEKGLVEEELNRLVAARASYQRALALLPTYLDAALALADLLRRQALSGEAVRLLVDLLLAEPYALDALVLLGRVLTDAGRAVEALGAFERTLRFDAEHLAALFHRGHAAARLRRYAAAIADWERVVMLAPTHPLAAAARSEARSAHELSRILAPAG